jgi:putative copper export protein/methionine-rich copper-binding protein CopC
MSMTFRKVGSDVRSLMWLLGSALLLLVAHAPATGWAHNGDKSSEPENGAVLDGTPTQVTFWFKQEVGQDNLTAFLIDPSGSRIPLVVLRAAGTEAVLSLPALTVDGEYGVRWKLISSDGHPVTDKIVFTLATGGKTTGTPETSVPTPPTAAIVSVAESIAPPTFSAATETEATTSTTAAPSILAPSTTPSTAEQTPSQSSIPVLPLPTLATDTTTAVVSAAAADEVDMGAPNWLRWSLRFGSYLAIFMLVGILATAMFIWPDTLAATGLRRTVQVSMLVIALGAVAQLAVLVCDIGASGAGESLKRIRSLDVGEALIARIATVLLVAALLHFRSLISKLNRVLCFVLLGSLLASWSWAGHAKSQRWTSVGIVLDVIHHGAAAAWLGALAVVGVVALRRVSDDHERLQVTRRLSSFALLAVIVTSVTGVLQSVRLLEQPRQALSSRYGTTLVVKVALVGLMLAVAYVNKGHVATASNNPAVNLQLSARLRRTILVELAIGLVIVAVTSSLVVAAPNGAETSARQLGVSQVPNTPGAHP